MEKAIGFKYSSQAMKPTARKSKRVKDLTNCTISYVEDRLHFSVGIVSKYQANKLLLYRHDFHIYLRVFIIVPLFVSYYT